MGWNDSDESQPDEANEQETPEKEAPAQEAEEKPEESSEEATPEPAADPEPEPEKQEKLVPESLVGKVAKSIREKGRVRETELTHRIDALEKQLQESQTTDYEEEDPNQNVAKIAEQKALEIFLQREDAYGRQKWGQEYEDSLAVIAAQNDSVLINKIWGAPKPAEAVMAEAKRIAEEMELGPDPATRERKKLEQIKAQVRKEVEAELQSKWAAQSNQPTDVSSLRAAGGDTKADFKRSSWTDKK